MRSVNPGVNQEKERPCPEERPLLLPGVKPVLELLDTAPERVDMVFLRKGRHGKEPERIITQCRQAGVRFSLLAPGAFTRMCPGVNQGVAARLFVSGYVALEDLLESVADAPLPLALVLDRVQDPGNAGTLARTLYALGGAGMVIPRHNGVYMGAVAVKASAGALEKLPVAKAASIGHALDRAKKLGLTVYGAVPARTEGLLSRDALTVTFRLPAVLVLGSEEDGMRPSMEKRCDHLVHIPMLRVFNSLNVAQAGGIIISCFARQRDNKPEF